jgi:hypothetical protein
MGAADDRCPECGERGRRVPRETMESLLTPEARERMADEPYRFDRTPGCEVVYYSNTSRSYYHKSDLRVRVGLKETEAPIPLCYCFDHTVASVREELERTGRSTVSGRIAAEVQAGNCACEVKNPSGRCCLGDVGRALRRIREELRPELARVEGGQEP